MTEKPSGARRPGRPARKLPADDISIEAILIAKQLISETGSVEVAKQTLAALATLSPEV